MGHHPDVEDRVTWAMTTAKRIRAQLGGPTGTALFESDGDRFDVGPGDFVFLPRGSVHTYLAGPALAVIAARHQIEIVGPPLGVPR